MLRPVALTMPSVTVWLNTPNGLPIARTHSATLSLEESPHGSVGRLRASIFSTREVGLRVEPDDLRRELPLVGQDHRYLRPAAAESTTWLFVTT